MRQRLSMFYRRIDALGGKMLLLVATDTILWIVFLVMATLKAAAYFGVFNATVSWVEIVAPGLAAIVTTIIGAIVMKKGGHLR